MTSIQVEIEGIDALLARYAEAPELTESAAHYAMQQSVSYLEKEVKKLTPVVSGTLRRSVTSRATKLGPVVVGVVWSPQNYAAAVEEGAKPRVIVPRHKKALYWKGADHPVLRVNWPGFEGRRMFQKGMDNARIQIETFFRDAAQRVADWLEFGKK